jgi:surface protein
MSLGVGVPFNFNKLGGGGGAAPSNPNFISTWQVVTSVTLPMAAGVAVVDWGDGTIDTTNYHVYSSAGLKTISISGTIEGWRFNLGGDRKLIRDIVNWGSFNITTNSVFYGCTRLTISATDAPTISNSSLYRFNFGGDILGDVDFTNWNTSGVSDWRSFVSSPLFNGNMEVLDYSSALNMKDMLTNCDSFDRDISSLPWDQFTDLRNFLQGASGLSTANYDALLIAADSLGAMAFSGTVNFGGSQYSCRAEAARTSLISKWGGITDGGLNTSINCNFVSTWDTTQAGSASDTIVLPMTAGNTVHWGDGSSDTTNTHTYASGGVYTVTIEGAVTTFRFNNGGDRRKIVDISNWGGFDVSNNAVFYGCSNLDITATDYPIISTASLDQTFRGCSSLTSPNFNAWDVSSVTNMSNMFYKATFFNQNISSWDVSSVTNMTFMFYVTSFNQNIGGWDVSSVTDMSNMLRDADDFNQDISLWDINQVSNFLSFMQNATGLSTANYDALLIAWDAQGAMSYSGTVNFGGSQYTSGGAAETARTSLISKWGGIIDGGGV